MKEASDTDSAAVRLRQTQVRSALGGDLRDCESRRVTDKTMACVKASATTRELDACLR